jgi:sensor histidine kinase YesM
MLESFTDYLRTSLGSLRHERSSLGHELDLAGHYLSLLKMRMEDRLNFQIEIDPALREADFPPLLLQPLIENAIHHGLEPKVEGGIIRITVQRKGNMLELNVADNGMGLDQPRRRPGAGMALANVRERLQTHYGACASLTLTDARSGTGTLATMCLPFIRGERV